MNEIQQTVKRRIVPRGTSNNKAIGNYITNMFKMIKDINKRIRI